MPKTLKPGQIISEYSRAEATEFFQNNPEAAITLLVELPPLVNSPWVSFFDLQPE